MAIVLEANYSKKLGLPGFSSHQYSITLRTELTDLAQVQAESSRLYGLLQTCVDLEMQKTGYLPENQPGNGQSRTNNGNGAGEAWGCSPKQKALILRIVEEHGLDKKQIEAVALDRFGKSVKTLNKLEASALLDELLRHAGANGEGNGWRQFDYRASLEAGR